MTWGAYLPGIARTVVNCNQNCNQEPGAGVVRHRRREWGGRRVGVWVAGPAGMAAGPCLWVAAWMVRCWCAVHTGRLFEADVA